MDYVRSLRGDSRDTDGFSYLSLKKGGLAIDEEKQNRYSYRRRRLRWY
jgi:hypothetical protein